MDEDFSNWKFITQSSDLKNINTNYYFFLVEELGNTSLMTTVLKIFVFRKSLKMQDLKIQSHRVTKSSNDHIKVV